jgi:hypothetical protein
MLFSISYLSFSIERVDELSGTVWVYQRGGITETFDFLDSGNYTWNSRWSSGISESNKGTYFIEGSKLTLISEGVYSERRTIAEFSNDRRSFSYSDRVFKGRSTKYSTPFYYPVRTLIVENIPSDTFSVGIYSENSIPRSRNDYRNMTYNSYIGGGEGNSPFEVIIFASVQSVPRFITIIGDDSSNARFTVVEFGDNNTIVINWNNMTDYHSLPQYR